MVVAHNAFPPISQYSLIKETLACSEANSFTFCQTITRLPRERSLLNIENANDGCVAGALLAMSRGVVYSGYVVSRLEQHSAALAPVEGVEKKLLYFDCAEECILQLGSIYSQRLIKAQKGVQRPKACLGCVLQ